MAEDSNFEVTTTTCHAFLLVTLMVIPSIPIATTIRSSRGFELSRAAAYCAFTSQAALRLTSPMTNSKMIAPIAALMIWPAMPATGI